ncbi:NlpC/P60 family protein [Macrococcus carouselicus]|nr:NlpC/P60 family protein [Macrococcus carouselicus]
MTEHSAVHADEPKEKVEAGHYQVKKGDTLLEVADKFEISTLRLKKWNHLTSDTLKPGKVLVVSADKVDAALSVSAMLKPGVEATKPKEEISSASAPLEEEKTFVPAEEVTAEVASIEQPAPIEQAPDRVEPEVFSPADPALDRTVTMPAIQRHDEEVNQINISDYAAQDVSSLLPDEQPSVVLVPDRTTAAAPSARSDVAQLARQVAVGKSYVYGANSATQVDCSSFAQQVFAAMGKKLPRTTYEQMAVGKRITDPEPGDLVFFNEGSHVGIYIGNGQMIDALNPREGIKQRAVSYIDGTVTGYYRY